MNSLRNSRTPYIKSVRPLREADLLALRAPAQRPQLQKIRDAHHNVARLAALGLSQLEIASRSGYSLGRVNQLLADPQMQNLISGYRGKVDDRWAEATDHYLAVATANMLKAERQLSEKLDEADESGATLPTRELIAISRDAADRFGYGKRSMNLNVNVDFAAKLEQAIQRSAEVKKCIA